MMDLSIVILHHGDPNGVTRTLKHLHKASLPSKTEVFVINNGRRGCNAEVPFSGDGSVGPALDFELSFFEIPNKGYPQGMNFGAAMAKGRYICLLTDIEVEKNTFKILMDYMEAHPNCGVTAPRLVYADGSVQDNFRVFPRAFDLVVKRTMLCRLLSRRMRRYLMWDKNPEESEAVDWLTGAMQLFTRKCWDAIGPKDERYFLFMSDVDICRTAWDHGYEVHFVGDTQALHSEMRLSAGGVMEFFKKRTMRIHVWDALKYYFKYRRRPVPRRAPSASRFG